MARILEPILLLTKRINLPITASTTPAQIQEAQQDPWSKSGKYALGWVYFSIILLIITGILRLYYQWGDKVRIALYRETGPSQIPLTSPYSQSNPYNTAAPSPTAQYFQRHGYLPTAERREASASTIAPFNNTVALVRWIFYRPVPVLKIWRLRIGLPSLGASAIVLAALIFVTLYCFIPRPLYYPSINVGSPPLAIRAGMIAVSMVPWIVALSMKANFVAIITGIGHERLNVFHRWGGYICLFLGLIHTIPFYVTPIWNDGAMFNYQSYLPKHIYVYGTGLAALVPLIFLCVHSLPILRAWMYELFVFCHLPVSIVFIAMLFWHCKNFLTSWNYLWATIAIWIASLFVRLYYQNWTSPIRQSFGSGEESTIIILPGNAVKVTIPTQMRWKPGQFVYLRIPQISYLESHPFTISSLCSDDFPSVYGKNYRDMALVFRPFEGFTRKAYSKALENGPYKTYTALLEGPYGGMRRDMSAFDNVVFVAGGSGITAIASQLLDLVKKMRDGKAVTKSVQVIWSLKSLGTMEWFDQELRICREFAPPSSVFFRFFFTGSISDQPSLASKRKSYQDTAQEKLQVILRGTADPHESHGTSSSSTNVPYKSEKSAETLTPPPKALPASHLTNYGHHQGYQQPYPTQAIDGGPPLPPPAPYIPPSQFLSPSPRRPAAVSTVAANRLSRWQTEFERPDIPRMLRDLSQTFGRRACVFVCGPPSMRVEVSNTVARLQQQILACPDKDEIFLHAENYNL